MALGWGWGQFPHPQNLLPNRAIPAKIINDSGKTGTVD